MMQRNARSLLRLRSISHHPSPKPSTPTPILPSPPKSPSKPLPQPIQNPLPPPIRFADLASGGRRGFSTGGEEPFDHNKEVDEINLKFAEAREEIESALESKETVYFNEEAECARDAVKTVLDLFNGLLAKLPEKDQMALRRSMGLKIEQLKAELQQLDE